MEESRSDGLEIISIGVIYTGDWDKKYWSSSRGRDRYPFPIGYKALRTHNAITYQMEIHEGSKGPSFLISSSDGHSCSGQTPDMAWDIFQKKGCPRIKLWRGKRFSCKIDGVEFFGFKNALVQRLLRELGTHNGIIAEHSSVTSSSINDDSVKENESSSTEITGPATLTNLKIPQVKGKRTRKLKSTNPNCTKAASCKKIRPEDEVPNEDFLDEDEVHNNQKDHNSNKHIPSLITSASNEEHEIHNDDKDSVMSLNLENVIEVKSIPSSVNDGLLVVSSPSSDHHPEGEEPVNSLLRGTTKNLFIDKNPLVRPTNENEESNLLVPEEPKDGEVSIATESESPKDVDLCVPDSLDSLQDKTCHSPLNLPKEKEILCNKQRELVAEVKSVTISETSTSNSNSEKNDFDSVGDDITKSMMLFLLPQALPLLSSKKKSPVLKTFSRKKRRVLKPLETFIGSEKIQKEMKEIDNRDSVLPGMHAKNPPLDREAAAVVNDSLDVFSFRNGASIVRDSFVSVEASCDVPQAKLATINDNDNSSNALEELSMGYDGTGFSDEKCDGQKLLVENHKNVIGTGSILGDLPSTENNLRKIKGGVCKNGGDFLCHEIHSKEKTPESSLETNEDNLTRQNKGPLSESIICRNSADDFVLQTNGSSEPKLPSVSHPVSLINNFDEDNVSMENSATSCSRSDNIGAEGLWAKPQMKLGNVDEQQNLRFMGRYVHPFPISLVLLSTNGEEVCICVLCGGSVDQEKNLFMYKLSTKERILGSPSFIGHTALILPLLKDAFKREISMDRTCLQLTPDGHSLVVLNSVKAPWCREGDLKCLCSACISSCSENMGLTVLQVKSGYVSVVVKLTTAENVQCILVCEPNYLIGVEESGILHLWVMNSTWSALIEECDLSTSNCIFPCIVELKKIPNHSSLVLGHNGFGEFGLWDIDKRVFVARFSSSNHSVYQFLPISVFRWQRIDPVITMPHGQGKEQCTENMASTRRSLLKQDENKSLNPLESDGVAIWILISTICNSDIQHEVQLSEHNTVGLWRLALVVENTVILGNALDHRAVAVGSSTDNGIIGTKDGAVYTWDLFSGTKLCDLHHFQGVGVSTIATDDSNLGPIAIAGGDQLLVYLHSSQVISNATSDKHDL